MTKYNFFEVLKEALIYRLNDFHLMKQPRKNIIRALKQLKKIEEENCKLKKKNSTQSLKNVSYRGSTTKALRNGKDSILLKS